MAPLSEGTNTVEDASDGPESERSPKGKKSKRDKKDKAVKALQGDDHEKPEKKAKRGKKNKKEKAAKAAKLSKQENDQEQDKKAKRDKPRGKKDKSTVAPKLRPLRKVNVLLIEPDGQPRAHFDGEIADCVTPPECTGTRSRCTQISAAKRALVNSFSPLTNHPPTPPLGHCRHRWGRNRKDPWGKEEGVGYGGFEASVSTGGFLLAIRGVHGDHER